MGILIHLRSYVILSSQFRSFLLSRFLGCSLGSYYLLLIQFKVVGQANNFQRLIYFLARKGTC